MSPMIPEWIERLQPYHLASSQAWTMADRGDVYKGDWNESLAEPTPLVRKRLTEFLENTHHLQWYPPIDNPSLVSSIGAYCGVCADHILLYNGSDSALDNIAKTLLTPHDEAILCVPTYDNFRVSIEVAGADIRRVQFTDVFSFDRSAVFAAKTPRTKMVYLVSPANPTGWHLAEEQLEQVLHYFSESWVIVDEAYAEFLGTTFASWVDRFTNLLIVRTFSKAFALAGFRIGYVIAPPVVVSALSKVKNYKEVNTFAQIAAQACLDDLEYMRDYVRSVAASKERLRVKLSSLGAQFSIKEGNFFLLKVSDVDRCITDAQRDGLFIRPMNPAYGLGGHVRITIGDDASTRRLERFLGQHPQWITDQSAV